MKALLLFAIKQNHIKTSRKRNDELVQIPVCMAAALGSARYVVKIINAFDLKGHMPPAFNEREIASWIADFGEVNDPTFGQTHELRSSSLRWILSVIANPPLGAGKTTLNSRYPQARGSYHWDITLNLRLGAIYRNVRCLHSSQL